MPWELRECPLFFGSNLWLSMVLTPILFAVFEFFTARLVLHTIHDPGLIDRLRLRTPSPARGSGDVSQARRRSQKSRNIWWRHSGATLTRSSTLLQRRTVHTLKVAWTFTMPLLPGKIPGHIPKRTASR